MEEQQTNTEQVEQEATTIGMFLKYSRLKQKKSIEEASEALCIRKVYIKALEDDDYETLPPIPYGVGFVRSYAAYLGLNAQRIAQIYKQQAFPQKEKNVQTVVTEHTELTIPKKKQIFIALIAIVLLYVLWLGGRTAFDNEDVSEAQIEPTIEVIDIEPVNEEPEEQQPAAKEEEEKDEKELISEKPETTEGKDVSQKEKQIITLEMSYPEENKPAEIKKSKIGFRLKGQSWLELKDANKVYVSGVKNKGFEFSTDFVPGMILSLGKYYNVDVYIDGKLTTVAGPKKQTNINLDQFLKH